MTEQKTMTEKEVKQFVRKCMNHLKLKRYELNITKRDVDLAVKRTIVNPDNQGSSGGKMITIGLKPWAFFKPYQNHSRNGKGSDVFHEYASFNDDPVIGAIQTHTLRNMLKVIIAHEVAHYVQMTICPRVRRFDRFKGVGTKRKTFKAHGQVFQTIYRMLRRDLINPMIAEKNANYKGL